MFKIKSLKKSIYNNFNNLLLSRLSLNLADSLFYMLTIWSISKESPLLTSFAILCFTIPENIIIFFGPFIDRYNHKKILITNSIIQIILIILLTILLAYNNLATSYLFCIIFISTLLGNINYEVEETMIPNIVPVDKLVKANSIMEVSNTIVDSIFNGISGFLISAFSAFMLYKIDAILFFITLIFLNNLKIENKNNPEKYSFKEYKKDLIEGIKILFQEDVKKIFIPLIFINFFFVMTIVATPFLARRIENAAVIFGSLILVKGIAGFFGAFISTFLDRYFKIENAISLCVFLQGFLWVLMIIGIDNNVFLFIMYFLSFVFFGASNILFESLFQKIIPIDFLGRANTACDAIITSAMPAGTLLAGFLLEQGISLSPVILPYGIVSILTGIYYGRLKF